MKKPTKSNPPNVPETKDKTSASVPKIKSDDRLGPDEPLDEAEDLNGPAPEVAGQIKEEQPSSHRVRKFEPDDEHNNEDLVDRGLRGSMKKPDAKG